jgi:hypothetical protein
MWLMIVRSSEWTIPEEHPTGLKSGADAPPRSSDIRFRTLSIVVSQVAFSPQCLEEIRHFTNPPERWNAHIMRSS